MNLNTEHDDVVNVVKGVVAGELLYRELLQGSSQWRCRALSTSPAAAQRTSDARLSTCQMFRSDYFSFESNLSMSGI